MASLRVDRIAAGVANSVAALRVDRIAAGVAVTAATPVLRVSGISAGVAESAVAFAVTATSNITGPARSYTRIQFTGTATPPAGEAVVSWLWTALSSDAPPLSSRSVQNPTARLNPQLTARTLSWSLTVTSSSGAQSTATVSVPAQAAKYRTRALDGSLHAFDWLGTRPTGGTPPPPTVKRLRVQRIAAGVLAPVTPPPPPGENRTTMIGGRVNLPGDGGNESDWFATGETWYGQLQCTKDYWPSGRLPATYNSPFPSDVSILLSHSDRTQFTWATNWDGSVNPDADVARWRSYINSLPGNTILTYQHEPERPGYWAGNPEEYVDRLNRYRDEVRSVRTDIPVWMFSSGYQYRTGNPGHSGLFFSGPRAADPDVTYRNRADGFGYDGYRPGTNNVEQGSKVIALQDRYEFMRWKGFIPAGKAWGASEVGFGRVNDPPDYPEPGLVPEVAAQRLATIPASVDWLIEQGGAMFLYFFSGDGPDGHNWLPRDQAFKDMYQDLPRKT